MAKFLTNKETQAALERIIIKAEKKLILISPYIILTNTLLARIKTAAEKNVEVRIVYRNGKVTKEELDKLNTIKNVVLKKTDDLHAKCYFNEKELIVTSLNLLASSEKNWEMGVLITRNEDKEIYNDAVSEAKTIYEDSMSMSKPVFQATSAVNTKQVKQQYSQPIKFVEPVYELKTLAQSPPKNGLCIRCEKKIDFDPSRPYCFECWGVWAKYNDPKFTEKVCHHCGKYWPTNMNEPRCNECKKKIDFLPINETLTSLIHKLSKKLGQEYPGHEIKTLSKSVLIKGFLNKPVSLELLPEREHFRIVFKLEHSPARLRKKAYDDLSEKHFFTIRDSFPKDSVKMGNEMKRIKIDLNNTNHPEFFGNCDDVTSNTIDLIQNGIKTIVTKLS
jgi:hypothetical protein